MNGVLVIDKPKGLTSQDVVTRVRKTLQLKKAGHGGTLDPLATGVLPVYLNEGTKLAPFNLDGTKDYIAVMKLGQETTTLDAEGEITQETQDFHVEPDEILAALARFQGKIGQVPPLYSAIKWEGKPLYRRARAGETLTLAPREVVIHRLVMNDFSPPLITLEITCGRGTYIRSLCADIGKALGCGAHLVALRRLRSGKFRIDQALSLEEFSRRVEMKTIGRSVIPLKDGIDIAGEIRVDSQVAERVRQGRSLSLQDFAGREGNQFRQGERVRLLNGSDNLLAIIESPTAESPDRADHPPVFRLLRVFHS